MPALPGDSHQFSDGVLRDRAELEQRIRDILRTNREALGLLRSADLPEHDTAGSLSDLIRQAHQRSGQRGFTGIGVRNDGKGTSPPCFFYESMV